MKVSYRKLYLPLVLLVVLGIGFAAGYTSYRIIHPPSERDTRQIGIRRAFGPDGSLKTFMICTDADREPDGKFDEITVFGGRNEPVVKKPYSGECDTYQLR